MEIIGTARKWGNSLGVAIPKKLLEKAGIKEKDRVRLKIEKVGDIADLFGFVRFEENTQKMKDELREGWDND